MEENNNVPYKAGDKIYLQSYGSIVRRETIIRITPTLIRSENYTYRKPSNGSTYLEIRGRDMRNRLTAHLETPELKKQWQEQDRREWMERNYKDIPSQDIDMLRAKMRAKDERTLKNFRGRRSDSAFTEGIS